MSRAQGLETNTLRQRDASRSEGGTGCAACVEGLHLGKLACFCFVGALLVPLFRSLLMLLVLAHRALM